MTIKKTYVADDGMEFNSEVECMEYEEKKSRKVLTRAYYDDNNWLTLLQSKDGTYYVQVDTGDYRSGGVIFDGTITQFVKKYLDKIRGIF